MSDNYQAIYDAVRSRISGGNLGDVAREVMWQQFDISFMKESIAQEIYSTVAEYRRPSAVYRPTLSADGIMWCALLGDNLQVGVAGFGETPEGAMAAFDVAFSKERTPTATRAALEQGKDTQ